MRRRPRPNRGDSAGAEATRRLARESRAGPGRRSRAAGHGRRRPCERSRPSCGGAGAGGAGGPGGGEERRLGGAAQARSKPAVASGVEEQSRWRSAGGREPANGRVERQAGPRARGSRPKRRHGAARRWRQGQSSGARRETRGSSAQGRRGCRRAGVGTRPEKAGHGGAAARADSRSGRGATRCSVAGLMQRRHGFLGVYGHCMASVRLASDLIMGGVHATYIMYLGCV